jgi:DNA repair protein RadD
MRRWPHQTRAVEAVREASQRGVRRLLLSAPTGGGKSLIMSDLALEWASKGDRVVLYTNRRVLVDQTARYLAGQGVNVGVRAAGYVEQHNLLVQVSSIQTEGVRVLRKGKWGVHDAQLVLVDEAHSQANATAKALLDCHEQGGAMIVGLTATPVGLSDFYEELAVCGATSELRECGALLMATHYACDEPDPRTLRIPLEQVTEGQAKKAIMRKGVEGRVLQWLNTLNPQKKPTILFAPGVEESVWFMEQLEKAGWPSAHVDGQNVCIGGRWYRSDRSARDAVMEASKDGRVRVLCNRFVLREGVDAPWLSHGVFATVFGSLQAYLQSGGRLLRSHPGLAGVTIQDHGGNWWRWGSLNADRIWHLEDTPSRIASEREDGFRDRGDPQPYPCPECGLVLMGGKCRCGYQAGRQGRRGRPVVQTDGTLRMVQGDPYARRVRICKDDTRELWRKMYYRAHRAGMNFRQAQGLFVTENHYWPPVDLPLMPKAGIDWHCRVDSLSASDLY